MEDLENLTPPTGTQKAIQRTFYVDQDKWELFSEKLKKTNMKSSSFIRGVLDDYTNNTYVSLKLVNPDTLKKLFQKQEEMNLSDISQVVAMILGEWAKQQVK